MSISREVEPIFGCIYFAEPDAGNRLLMDATFRQLSREIGLFNSQVDLLTEVARDPSRPDLIIADLFEKPHLLGFVSAVREFSGRNVPVIVLTSYDNDHKYIKATRGHLAAVLAKPYSPLDLITLVDGIIRPQAAS